MQTTKRPYELLFRWDQQGKLSGAHVQYRYVIEDGAQVIGESVGSAESLTLDTGDGFPLADLLTQVQVDAMTAKATAEAERDAAVSAARDLMGALEAVTAEMDKVRAEVDRLSQAPVAAP